MIANGFDIDNACCAIILKLLENDAVPKPFFRAIRLKKHAFAADGPCNA
jgi:hypothetical protein